MSNQNNATPTPFGTGERTSYSITQVTKFGPVIEKAGDYWHQLAIDWIIRHGHPGLPRTTAGISVSIRKKYARRGDMGFSAFLLHAQCCCHGNERTWMETAGAVIEFLSSKGLKDCTYQMGLFRLDDFADYHAFSVFCGVSDPQVVTDMKSGEQT